MIKDPVQRRYCASVKGRVKRAQYQRDNIRRIKLKARYNLTPEQYDAILLAQGGGCATCHRVVKRFHVDHCHLTGVVRGILCPSCNRALGLINENPDTAYALSAYLEKHR